MICSVSAVLRGCPSLASPRHAKSLVSDVGAGTGTRTPGLLITSNRGPSGVLTGPIGGRAPSTRERERQSYQLSWHASRRRRHGHLGSRGSRIQPFVVGAAPMWSLSSLPLGRCAGAPQGAYSEVTKLETIPVVLCFDIEPDARAPEGRKPGPREGFEKLFPLVTAMRDRLASASGQSTAFTWCLRIDPQIAEIYGSSTWLADRYERELTELGGAGDEFGLHPHSWRWQGRWVSDAADPDWVSHCIDVGLDGYRKTFGQPCRVHKHGDNFMSTAVARQLDEAGVAVDLSIVPGMPAARSLSPMEETTGWLPDTRTVPSHVYRPARDDFRLPDRTRREGLVMMPETAGVTLALHPVDGRVMPTGWYEPLVLWLEPERFREMLRVRLGAPALTHLLFCVRTDTVLHPDRWANVEANQTELVRQLRDRHRWCTGSEGAQLALAHLRNLDGPPEPTEQIESRARLWLRGTADPGYQERVDLHALDLDDDHALVRASPTPALSRVSVIIPVYDGRRHLRGAIESVISQTEPPEQLVIVVDGSNDEDLDFLDGLTAPFSVRVVHQANAGQSAARNAGVKVATGELLAFLDQDDLWHPEHLSALSQPLRHDPTVVWSYCDFDEIEADGQFVTRRYLREHGVEHPKHTLASCVERDLMVLPSASVLRRDAFEALGGFDETLRGYEDDDLYIRTFRSGGLFAFVPRALTFYRVHRRGGSAGRQFAESRLRFSEKLQATIPNDPRTGRYYFCDLIVPRFFGASLDDYVQSVSAQDWTAATQALADLMHFGRLRRDRARIQWKLALARQPRLFRLMLRLNDQLPPSLRVTSNPRVRLR
jgi:glycosyltransferase involved in cell wall biosynthesis